MLAAAGFTVVAVVVSGTIPPDVVLVVGRPQARWDIAEPTTRLGVGAARTSRTVEIGGPAARRGVGATRSRWAVDEPTN